MKTALVGMLAGLVVCCVALPCPAAPDDWDDSIRDGGVVVDQQTQQDPPNPIAVGGSVTFNVQGQTDGEYLFYQWQRDGTDIFGAA